MKIQNKKTLVIVESPAKATKIQSYLGDNYIVKSTKGHILELASGGKYGLGVNINNNFEPKYLIMSDKIDLLQELMDLAKQAKEVILSTDADREGLAIARHIYDRLKDYNSNFKRITFSEITKKSILKSLESAEDILSENNINMYHSQTARRILDRLVGYMASPFLFQFFGPNLSAGRVQSCILRMLVERENQIEHFKPEEFFNIQGNFITDNRSFIAKYDTKISNKEQAEVFKKDLLSPQTIYKVVDVKAEQEIKKPFPPLITAKLQQIMSKQYKMNSTRTMAAAQSLYENSLISYMRTDSVRISDDATKSLRVWLKDQNYDVPKTINIFKNKNTAQDAHEAIRPTEVSDIPSSMNHLLPDEQLVYEVIWKYFVASQMKPAIFDTLKITIKAQNQLQHTFIASGKSLQYRGFLEILGNYEIGAIDLPTLQVGTILKLYGDNPIIVERKQTQPPARYSEASLIETLEKKEIGRPSTYSTLLSTITARNYVEIHGNVFHPTELGKNVIQELVKWFSFLEYDYSAKLELELDKIAEGKLNYIQMLNSFYNSFYRELTNAYIDRGSPICTKCNGFMRKIKGRDGKEFFGCSNWPRCVSIKNLETSTNTANT